MRVSKGKRKTGKDRKHPRDRKGEVVPDEVWRASESKGGEGLVYS